MISQSFIQELLNRVDIVDVIDRHIPLKKAGANYTACCPFHSEKTPSFTVSPTKQFYHCFGCSAHGNAIGFLMEYNGMTFVEAVNDLAARVGMQVPAQQSESHSTAAEQSLAWVKRVAEHHRKEAKASSKDLLEVMDVAARFYREQLRHSDSAIAYLKKRGITGETAASFRHWLCTDWLAQPGSRFSRLRQRKAQQKLLVKSGLVIENADGKYYDRFRDRIMFPILNLKGRNCGFWRAGAGARRTQISQLTRNAPVSEGS